MYMWRLEAETNVKVGSNSAENMKNFNVIVNVEYRYRAKDDT